MRPNPQERREHTRESCCLSVKGLTGDSAFKALAKNISLAGAFIETQNVFAVDEKIVLSFTLPGQDEPIKIVGKIVWNGPGGFGVQFTDTPKRLVSAIKFLVPFLT